MGGREAAEILVAIESTGGARAAVDGPGGPQASAPSARRVQGSGCCRARRLGCLAASGRLPDSKGGLGVMGLEAEQAMGPSHAGSKRWVRVSRAGALSA